METIPITPETTTFIMKSIDNNYQYFLDFTAQFDPKWHFHYDLAKGNLIRIYRILFETFINRIILCDDPLILEALVNWSDDYNNSILHICSIIYRPPHISHLSLMEKIIRFIK